MNLKAFYLALGLAALSSVPLFAQDGAIKATTTLHPDVKLDEYDGDGNLVAKPAKANQSRGRPDKKRK